MNALSLANSASLLLFWVNRTTGLPGHSSGPKLGRDARKNRSWDVHPDALLPQHLLLPAAFAGHVPMPCDVARSTTSVGPTLSHNTGIHKVWDFS